MVRSVDQMAIEDLLVKSAKMIPKPKLQSVLPDKNYALMFAILKLGTVELVSQLPAVSDGNVPYYSKLAQMVGMHNFTLVSLVIIFLNNLDLTSMVS
jgi:hypothetical protein